MFKGNKIIVAYFITLTIVISLSFPILAKLKSLNLAGASYAIVFFEFVSVTYFFYKAFKKKN